MMRTGRVGIKEGERKREGWAAEYVERDRSESRGTGRSDWEGKNDERDRHRLRWLSGA